MKPKYCMVININKGGIRDIIKDYDPHATYTISVTREGREYTYDGIRLRIRTMRDGSVRVYGYQYPGRLMPLPQELKSITKKQLLAGDAAKFVIARFAKPSPIQAQDVCEEGKRE